MSDTCRRARDRLPELALGVLGGTERAEVLDHLAGCEACREVAAEHAAVADMLPLLLAEAEPPGGFEARALARLEREPRADRGRGRRALLALAAAAIVVALVSIGAAVGVRDAGREPAEERVEAATMIGHGGTAAGKAFVVGGTDRYVFVAVDYGVASGSYAIEVIDQGGTRRLGTMEIADGRGSWAGGDEGRSGLPAAVRLVDASGEPVCEARFEKTDG